jgi:hypothetical protein
MKTTQIEFRCGHREALTVSQIKAQSVEHCLPFKINGVERATSGQYCATCSGPVKLKVDFTVENHGSICLIRPHNPAVTAWFDEHVGDYQTCGSAVVVEPRYVSDIVSGLEAAGFSN